MTKKFPRSGKTNPVGQSLSGKITDRILRGLIPHSTVMPPPRPAEQPSASAIKRAKGQGLGKGATKARGGKER